MVNDQVTGGDGGGQVDPVQYRCPRRKFVGRVSIGVAQHRDDLSTTLVRSGDNRTNSVRRVWIAEGPERDEDPRASVRLG